jgi:hypothetical protein
MQPYFVLYHINPAVFCHFVLYARAEQGQEKLRKSEARTDSNKLDHALFLLAHWHLSLTGYSTGSLMCTGTCR